MMRRLIRPVCLLLVFTLLSCLLCTAALADGEPPFGDGNGIVSRPLLASLYKWLSDMSTGFRRQLSFEDVSNAVGKWGIVKDTEGDTTRGASWTDGNAFVTVTFKNLDGFWGASSIATTLGRDEYGEADTSFLPRVGNRDAGSSPTAPVTLTTQVKQTGADVSVTAQVPSEYWYSKVAFGEVRYMNEADEKSASSSSSSLSLSFWPDEASIQEVFAKDENRTEAESLWLLGQEMKGVRYTNSGMNLTGYTAKIADDLWMLADVYQLNLYDGTEAEAILKSLEIVSGDVSFSWKPLDLGPDDGFTSGLFGDDFSFDVIRDSDLLADGTLYLEDDEDGDLYLNSNFTAEELAFTHNLESDQYYSYADFDMFIWNSAGETTLPILRLYFYLNTQGQPVDVTSVTITSCGKDYTFSGVYRENYIREMDGDYQQMIVILFDAENGRILSDLALSGAFGDTVPVVFHGNEEIRTELGENFFRVFDPYYTLYTESEAESNLSGYEGTPMEYTLAAP